MRNIVILLMAFLTIQPYLQAAGKDEGSNESKEGTVPLVGEGKLQVTADRAVIQFRVSTESKTFSEGIQRNEQLRQKIATQLIEKGIPTERIKSARFSSNPEYSKWTDKVKTYSVVHQMRVTVENSQQFGIVASLIDHTPEARLENIKPEVSNLEEQRLKAATEAFKNLEGKRKLYEANLKLRLTPKSAGEISPVTVAIKSGQTPGKLSSFTGILTDPAFSSVIRGLEQRTTDMEGAFGEMSLEATIVVEYAASPKFTFQ